MKEKRMFVDIVFSIIVNKKLVDYIVYLFQIKFEFIINFSIIEIIIISIIKKLLFKNNYYLI